MNQRFASACAAACFALAISASAAAQSVVEPTPSDAIQRADARADRIQALEDQLRDATAENERLQHELMLAQHEVQRLQGMVNDMAAANAAAPAPAPQTAAAPAPQASAAQRRATGNLAAQTPAPAAPAAPVDPAAAQDAYSRARVLLTAGRQAEAEQAFRDFLQNYANAPQAEDVRFLLPYTTLARGDYQGAAQGFLDYLQRYHNGARTPEAYARLGMALAGLGRNTDACTAFRQAQHHPRASNAVRQLAQREAGAISCPA
jgi:TolA-binding protein